MFNAKAVKDRLVLWIRNWFDANGPECNAIIGISGGKDSTVAAALCVEALGRDRVIGVLMPNGAQPDFNDAMDVVSWLQIRHTVINIERAFNACLDNVIYATGSLTNENHGYSAQTKVNLAPRLRMTTLYAISQSMNGRVVCTDNLSESYVGYSTRWGDNVGDFCPLLNLTSEEVMAIGDELELPTYLVHKTPSDGLCGLTDEDNFGFTYAVLNKYIRTGECEDPETKRRIDLLYQRNAFKRMPIPSFQYP